MLSDDIVLVTVRVKGPSLRCVAQGPRHPLCASFGKKLGSGSGLTSLSQPNASTRSLRRVPQHSKCVPRAADLKIDIKGVTGACQNSTGQALKH